MRTRCTEWTGAADGLEPGIEFRLPAGALTAVDAAVALAAALALAHRDARAISTTVELLGFDAAMCGGNGALLAPDAIARCSR